MVVVLTLISLQISQTNEILKIGVEVLERIEKRKDNIHLTYNVTANDAVHLHESKNGQKLTD